MKNLGRENKSKEKKDSVFTPETLGVVLILFATLALVCLISFDKIFGDIGLAIAQFLLGVFGFFAYPLFALIIFYGFLLVSGKKTGLSMKKKLVLSLLVFSVITLIHLITMRAFSGVSYGEYISLSYNRGEEDAFKCTGGGFVFGLIAGLLLQILSPVGAYVVISALTLFATYFTYLEFFSSILPSRKASKLKGAFTEQVETETTNKPEENTVEEVSNIQPNIEHKQKLFVADPNSFAFKTKRDLKATTNEKVEVTYTKEGLIVADKTKNYSTTYNKDIESKLNYIKTPAKIDVEKTLGATYGNTTANTSATYVKPYEQEKVTPVVSSPIPMREEKEESQESAIPLYEHDQTNSVDDAVSHAENFRQKYASVEEVQEPIAEEIEESVAEPKEESYYPVEEKVENIEETFEESSYETVEESSYETVEENTEISQVEEPAPSMFESPAIREIFSTETKEEEAPFETPRRRSLEGGVRGFGISERAVQSEEPKNEPIVEEVKEEKPVKEIPPINREYFRPSWDLLETYTPPADLPKENHEERQEIIKQTLEEFGISVEPQGFVQGPSITRYEIKMPAGVSVKKVLSFDDDLQMRLAARNGVRIEAPIPGKNLVGIEVANSSSVMVGLKEVLMGMAGQTFKPGSLIFALGKDIVGNSKYDDLSKGPHYLIAGSSGSGKSVCLNVMITSLIMRYSPEELRFILIDPKRVEMRKYEHIPHLMVDEIINEPKKALAVLQWAIDEMERRYAMFEEAGSFIDGIGAYNQYVASDTIPKMAKIVIVIDEFGDLMANVKKDLEVKIQILTQKARAAGIHIVLATQRPSANVVTGVIKTNLPSRIAFKVGNYTDSMIILDGKGAEKLLGNGDMLYKNSTMPDNERYQGAFISAREINNIVSYIIEKNKAYFDDDLKEYLEKVDKPKQEEQPSMEEGEGGIVNDANTDLLIRALSLAINAGGISISQVQRRFQIGYIRAAGIIDKMEGLGYISGNEGSKTRKVYITREEFEAKYGPMSD